MSKISVAIAKFCKTCWDSRKEGLCETKECPLFGKEGSKRQLKEQIRKHCSKWCCNNSSESIGKCQELCIKEEGQSDCPLYEYRGIKDNDTAILRKKPENPAAGKCE